MGERKPRHAKTVNLALQGGGAHGAFTWGVLDRLFEIDNLWIESISGTSAGAMNAIVAAEGMYDGAAEGARVALEKFWRAVSEAARTSPFKRTPLDQMLGIWSLDNSPAYILMDLMGRLTSPYDLNPFDINPLRDLVDENVDFDKVRASRSLQVYISATNVETGKVRVFSRDEITLDVVMASACLPFLFKAVEIEGEPYWDGGYMGNPVLFPFYNSSESDDIVIVQINPIYREGTPTKARDILNRVNEITFNSSLLRDLRAIEFVNRLTAEGKLKDTHHRTKHVHIIEARKEMRPLSASSKLNAEWDFLVHLRDIGREAADKWLKKNYDDIGKTSTVDLTEMFSSLGAENRG